MHRNIRLFSVIQMGFVANLVMSCANEDFDDETANDTIESIRSDTTDANTTEPTCLGHRKVQSQRLPANLRAVTFNAGLAPGFEPLATQRTPYVVRALAEAVSDADLLCVQEFWQKGDFAALETSLTELPHVLRMSPKPGSGSCSENELLPLFGCLSGSCQDAAGEELVGCAVTACPVEVATLSGGCLGCIMNHLEGLESCLAETPIASDPAIFGGSYDIGLFSRWPIQRAHQRELSSYFVRASVLHARVVVPRLGPVDAFCTHLGSDLGIVSYAGAFGSWEGEHRRQVEELLEFVRQENKNERPLLLLGDLNMGPAVGSNEAVLPDDYALLVNAGFDNAYATQSNPSCTNCPDTTFRGPDESREILDHVLSARLRLDGTVTERLFVAPVSLGDEYPLFNLSDHFGLKVSFQTR